MVRSAGGLSLFPTGTFNPAGMYFDDNGNIHYYENQTDNYQQDYYQLLYAISLNPFFTLNTALHYTRGKDIMKNTVRATIFQNMVCL